MTGLLVQVRGGPLLPLSSIEPLCLIFWLRWVQVSLGYSTSEAGAAQIYDREALRLRGSAAQLNFPCWSLSDAAAAAASPQRATQVRKCRVMASTTP